MNGLLGAVIGAFIITVAFFAISGFSKSKAPAVRVVGDVSTKPSTVTAQLTSSSKTAASLSGSAERKLLELKSLKDKGLISDSEYERKRAEIIQAL